MGSEGTCLAIHNCQASRQSLTGGLACLSSVFPDMEWSAKAAQVLDWRRAERACAHAPLAPVRTLVLLLLVHTTELVQQAGQRALLPPQDLQHAGQDRGSNAMDLVQAGGQGRPIIKRFFFVCAAECNANLCRCHPETALGMEAA